MNENYFDAHWRPLGSETIPLSKVNEARRFLAPILNAQTGEKPLHWLDVGCGDGVHLAILKAQRPDDQLTGVDMSVSAIDRARALLGGADVDLRIGDALCLNDVVSDMQGRFDVAFSYGVLAYTTDWRRGLEELAHATKPGGVIGFWIMAPPAGAIGKWFQALRSVMSKAPGWLQTLAANLLVPLLVILPTRSGVTPFNASWRACVEIVMVNIAPPSLVFPARTEILGAIDRHGLSVLHEDKSVPHSFWLRKPELDDGNG